MKRLLLLLALAGAIAAVAIPTASAAVRVLPLSAHPNGWNYDQWHTNYIRRALQKDLRSLHSLFAIRNGTCGQRVGPGSSVGCYRSQWMEVSALRAASGPVPALR